MQSQEELYNVLKTNQEQPAEHRTIVISISPQSRASLAAKYRLTLLQVHKRLVTFFKHHLGVHHVFDITYARDLSLVETAKEFVERYQSYLHQGGDVIEQQAQQQQQQQPEEGGRQRRRRQAPGSSQQQQQQQSIPMLASSCPGWVCYAEKTHGEVLPHISAAKSPQQMMGSLVKDYLATKTNTR